MAGNLIEQMNILKGLSDEALNYEMSAPSGAAPPYLVLTEVQRRKDMRSRYEGEAARQKRRTTVAEDLVMPMGGQMRPVGGIAAASSSTPRMAGLDGAVPGYADGGIIDYADIAKKYQERLGGLGEDRDRARAMALIMAGAGIMGGGSSNTLKNIGMGAQTGIASYADAIKTVDSDELALMRGLTDIGQLQQSLAQAEEDRGLRREEIDISRERLNTDRTPAAILTTRAYMDMTPEEQATHDRLNPPYNPNAVTNDMRVLEQANQAFDVALKSLPDPAFVEMGKETETAMQRQKQAALMAYPKWVALLGQAGANQMARQYGVSDGDLLLLASPGGAAVDNKDPLGLGL
jgi:hypothetical protein